MHKFELFVHQWESSSIFSSASNPIMRKKEKKLQYNYKCSWTLFSVVFSFLFLMYCPGCYLWCCQFLGVIMLKMFDSNILGFRQLLRLHWKDIPEPQFCRECKWLSHHILSLSNALSYGVGVRRGLWGIWWRQGTLDKLQGWHLETYNHTHSYSQLWADFPQVTQ